MAENYPGTITIGGKLPQSKVEEFLEVLRESGAGPDWMDGFPKDVQDAAALILLANSLDGGDGNGALFLMNNEARNGQFEELAKWCQDNDLPYDMHSDAHYEFNAYTLKWRPGFDKAIEVASDNDGGEFVDREKIAAARDALRPQPGKMSEQCIDEAIALLDEALGPDVPDVPKLEVQS